MILKYFVLIKKTVLGKVLYNHWKIILKIAFLAKKMFQIGLKKFKNSNKMKYKFKIKI